jgi:hypothetical protein
MDKHPGDERRRLLQFLGCRRNTALPMESLVARDAETEESLDLSVRVRNVFAVKHGLELGTQRQVIELLIDESLDTGPLLSRKRLGQDSDDRLPLFFGEELGHRASADEELDCFPQRAHARERVLFAGCARERKDGLPRSITLDMKRLRTGKERVVSIQHERLSRLRAACLAAPGALAAECPYKDHLCAVRLDQSVDALEVLRCTIWKKGGSVAGPGRPSRGAICRGRRRPFTADRRRC